MWSRRRTEETAVVLPERVGGSSVLRPLRHPPLRYLCQSCPRRSLPHRNLPHLLAAPMYALLLPPLRLLSVDQNEGRPEPLLEFPAGASGIQDRTAPLRPHVYRSCHTGRYTKPSASFSRFPLVLRSARFLGPKR